MVSVNQTSNATNLQSANETSAANTTANQNSGSDYEQESPYH
jgi:hypothetical protein